MSLPSLIRGLADIEEIEKVPFGERVKFRSTYEMIRAGAMIDPQKVATYFVLSGDTYDQPIAITHEQVLGRIHQAANLFHDAGIGPRDVVGIILPNLPQISFATWGGEAAGIACLINPALGAAQTQDILRAAKAKALVALGPMTGTDIWEKVTAIRPNLPDLQTIFQVLGPGDEKEGIYSFDEALGRYSAAGLAFSRTIEPTDVASLFHTGGTTGAPKLAPHTHLNEIHDAWAMGVMAALTHDDVALGGLPLFHANAAMGALAGSAVGLTGVLLAPAGFRDQGVIRNFYKIVAYYHATGFSGVPTLFAALLQVPIGDAEVGSLRFAFSGSAPLPVEVFREFERRTGIKILEAYGLTEGTCGCSFNPRDGDRRIGSVGIRIPYQGLKTVVADSSGKIARDCRPGEIGVVTVKGPNIFPGYLDPEHNAKVWLADGWLNTGDLGRMDEDGYLWLTGRAKELIIRGGHNIDPMEIENVLYRHPAVALAAAVGRPDAYSGEVPMAFVTLRPGSEATPEEILAHCEANIGERAAIPKEIRIIPEMPLTAVGKFFKPQLRWEATASVFSRELEAMSDLAEKVEVTCGEDKVHGTLARVTVRPRSGVARETIEARVKEVLGRYTVKYVLSLV